MKLEEALQTLEARERQCQSMIPANAPRLRTRYLTEMVEEQMEAARNHLRALYQSGLAVGPDFAALQEHADHPKYAFWLDGIRRHLQQCESILAEQPDGGAAGA